MPSLQTILLDPTRCFFVLTCAAMLAFALPRALGQADPANAAAGAPNPPGPPLLALQYCAGCHQPPRPGAASTTGWRKILPAMVEQMKEINLVPPPGVMEELAKYYLSNSPARFRPTPDDLEPSQLPFKIRSVGNIVPGARPEITNVNVTDLDQDGRQDVIVCDNSPGSISWLRFSGGEWIESILAEAPAPTNTRVLDFENDGDLDIVVAVMGFISPNDEFIGEVHLLLNRGDQTFEQTVLVNNVARVTEVAPGDFDGDGDIDFAVAMFGWRKTGGLAWLEQVSPGNFRFQEILVMNGVMCLKAVDLDDNGLPEIAALITQQHETIAVFSHKEGGKFTNKLIARANHPLFGSSGFDCVDLDQDGDTDILYTNGDMMDFHAEVKPYHGARWFENRDGEFHLRPLLEMPGCYCARAHDMDGDGDLDIVVSNLNFFWQEADFPSLIWLENDGKQNFTRRRISYSPVNLISCDVGDINHDGIPDIIAGGMHIPGPSLRTGRLTAWLSQPASEKPPSDP